MSGKKRDIISIRMRQIVLKKKKKKANVDLFGAWTF